MAMNPMQRKTRNAFLLGFIIALIVGGIVIAILFMKIKDMKEAAIKVQQETQIAMRTVYYINDKAEPNEYIATKLSTKQVPVEYVPDNAITPENIDFYLLSEDETIDLNVQADDLSKTQKEEYEKYNELQNNKDADDYTKTIAMKSKTSLSEGTILTADMVVKSNVGSTYRLVEYSMISLPSLLEEGDFVDIRIAFPEGTNFVVLSKKRIEACDATTIWLKLSETEMLTLNSAIVESYIVDATRIYATQYINDAQADLNVTYIPSKSIVALMEKNQNFTEAAYINNLRDDDLVKDARDYIDGYIGSYSSEERADAVEEGYQSENTAVMAARSALLGDTGY